MRDLAAKNGSVNPEQGFSLVWQMTQSGEAKLTEMAAASAGCRALLLATDPDREGEAISWHITEELKVCNMLRLGERHARSAAVRY